MKLTMARDTEANIVRALGKIIKQGHLHKGVKPVHWCIDCRSALAEAEVEYEEKQSPAIDVRFRVVDEADLLKRFGVEGELDSISVVIWTTTPWTLPANQAVALHPELSYVLVKTAQEVLILAEGLCETTLKRFEMEEHQVLGKCVGTDLQGVQLKHPVYD